MPVECRCVPQTSGMLRGYVADKLHDLGIHDPELAERLGIEADEVALDGADEIVQRAVEIYAKPEESLRPMVAKFMELPSTTRIAILNDVLGGGVTWADDMPAQWPDLLTRVRVAGRIELLRRKVLDA